MDLNYLKDKLKKTVKNSKTTKFVEDHKSDITRYGIFIGIGAVASLLLFKKINAINNEKLIGELTMRSVSYNTAAVKITDEKTAAKIFETAKAIDQSMHQKYQGIRYKDIQTIISNTGAKLPEV